MGAKKVTTVTRLCFVHEFNMRPAGALRPAGAVMPAGASKSAALHSTPATLERHTRRARRPLEELASPPQLTVPSPSPAPPASLFNVRVLLLENSEDPDRARWYNVRLVCRLRPELSWRVARRYSEFDALLQQLQLDASSSASLPRLPPKVPSLLLTSALQQQRVLGLQKWSQELLACPALCAHPAVAAFFDLDFGLWHQRAAAPAPLLLDAACGWAAVHVQSAWRAHRVKRRLRRALALANGGRSADFDLLDAAGKSAGSVINQLVLAAGSSSKALAVLVSAPWGAGSA